MTINNSSPTTGACIKNLAEAIQSCARKARDGDAMELLRIEQAAEAISSTADAIPAENDFAALEVIEKASAELASLSGVVNLALADLEVADSPGVESLHVAVREILRIKAALDEGALQVDPEPSTPDPDSRDAIRKAQDIIVSIQALADILRDRWDDCDDPPAVAATISREADTLSDALSALDGWQ